MPTISVACVQKLLSRAGNSFSLLKTARSSRSRERKTTASASARSASSASRPATPATRRRRRRSTRSGKLDRPRSRLYRSQMLQANMRSKALAEIYTMHSSAQLCNLIFWKNVANCLQNVAKKFCLNSANFKDKNEIRERCKGVHCVDLGERCQTHIYLQILSSIQPRTSPLKFGRCGDR